MSSPSGDQIALYSRVPEVLLKFLVEPCLTGIEKTSPLAVIRTRFPLGEMSKCCRI